MFQKWNRQLPLWATSASSECPPFPCSLLRVCLFPKLEFSVGYEIISLMLFYLSVWFSLLNLDRSQFNLMHMQSLQGKGFKVWSSGYSRFQQLRLQMGWALWDTGCPKQSPKLLRISWFHEETLCCVSAAVYILCAKLWGIQLLPPGLEWGLQACLSIYLSIYHICPNLFPYHLCHWRSAESRH